jgi:hypothetical protein
MLKEKNYLLKAFHITITTHICFDYEKVSLVFVAKFNYFHDFTLKISTKLFLIRKNFFI